jgi:hypothetical protein
MSIDRWMHKENIAYMHTLEYYLFIGKGWYPFRCYKRVRPWEHYAG